MKVSTPVSHIGYDIRHQSRREAYDWPSNSAWHHLFWHYLRRMLVCSCSAHPHIAGSRAIELSPPVMSLHLVPGRFGIESEW